MEVHSAYGKRTGDKQLMAKKQEPNISLREIMLQMANMRDADLDEPTEDDSEEAMAWYEQFATEAYMEITKTTQFDSRAKTRILQNSIPDFFVPRKREGMMYTFAYQPESQNLQYWDRFPLIIRMLDNLDSTESFLGINLHYIEPKLRRMLLLNLMTTMSGSELDEESRILGINMQKLFKPNNRYGRVCVRRYKYDNVRGRVLRIPPQYWMKMIYLPTYQFIGGKPSKIWKDSFKKIRQLGYGTP
jgi:hypothetical protein